MLLAIWDCLTGAWPNQNSAWISLLRTSSSMLCHAHWLSFIADSLWNTDDSDWLLHNSLPFMLWTHCISILQVRPSHWMRARKALLLHLFHLSGLGSSFFGLAWLGLAHNLDHFAYWQEHVSKCYKSFLLRNDAVSHDFFLNYQTEYITGFFHGKVYKPISRRNDSGKSECWFCTKTQCFAENQC